MQKFETLYKFIRPEIFFKKDDETETVGYIEGIEEKLGRKLTDEELRGIQEGPDQIEELDTIEHVEE